MSGRRKCARGGPYTRSLCSFLSTVLAADARAQSATPKHGILKFAVVAEPPNYDCLANSTIGSLHPPSDISFAASGRPTVTRSQTSSRTVGPWSARLKRAQGAIRQSARPQALTPDPDARPWRQTLAQPLLAGRSTGRRLKQSNDLGND
jgi:hypothetical protein